MAGRIKDLTNQKFGRLTARKIAYMDKKKRSYLDMRL